MAFLKKILRSFCSFSLRFAKDGVSAAILQNLFSSSLCFGEGLSERYYNDGFVC